MLNIKKPYLSSFNSAIVKYDFNLEIFSCKFLIFYLLAPKFYHYISNIIFLKDMLNCPICFTEIKRKIKLDCCDHNFCTFCINKWRAINPRCPLCRKKIKLIKYE